MKPVACKRARSPIAAAALTAVLTGCTVLYEAPDRVAGIEPGASKVQVSAALGAPNRVIRSGDHETWLYCHESAFLDRFVVAEFKGGTLKSARQNLDFEFGACEPFYERFDPTSSG